LFDEEQHFEINMPSVEIIRRFIDLLEVNFPQERSVKFYAGQLTMHPNHLNSLIKKHTGLTAKESIQNRVLLEMKYLLHSTNLSIKEISNQVGFNDPNYFTSFFTRFENMSPGNYRSLFI
jgi:AraC family transcriptional regulator, transcriptional activator of pobA